jgi:hypothetical protein
MIDVVGAKIRLIDGRFRRAPAWLIWGSSESSGLFKGLTPGELKERRSDYLSSGY